MVVWEREIRKITVSENIHRFLSRKNAQQIIQVDAPKAACR